MTLVIKAAENYIPLASAVPVRGSKTWERDTLISGAVDLLSDDEFQDLKRAARAGIACRVGCVALQIIKLHSSDGRMKFEDHLSCCRVDDVPEERIEDVTDVRGAMEVVRARAGSSAVQVRQGGNLLRFEAATGLTYRCGRAPGHGFSEDLRARTVPVIATLEAPAIRAVLL